MNKMRIFLFPLLLIASVVHGQDIDTALKNCNKEKDSSKRLQCFDQVVKDINQPQVAEAPKPPTAKVPPKQSASQKVVKPITANTPKAAPLPIIQKAVVQAKADFGLEHKKVAELNEDKLYAQVSSVSKDAYKNLIISLSNGQVWKQTEAKYFKVKAGDTIYVERGVLSSFFLGIDDNNRRIRVKRIE